MADLKISQLTAATLPLAGTEVLPIVQSGVTTKVATNDLTVCNLRAAATTGILQVSGPTAGTTRTVTVPDANFTAARTDAAQSFTGDQTLSNGNLVVSDGKGIDFSATPGAGTSELLADYEEGTWDPVFAPTSGAFGAVTYAFKNATYTKIGNTVRVNVAMRTNAFAVGTGTGNVVISGLPFAAGSTGNAAGAVGFSSAFNTDNPNHSLIAGSATTIGLYTRGSANGNSVALPVSSLQNGANQNYIILTAVYNV
jgi:hypothetical protein